MQNFQVETFYSGLSGLHLPIPKYLFPSPFENSSRLTYYSTLFNSIEINSSFYKVPKAVTVSKWAGSVSENFKFTFKLWKGITHSKGLDFNIEDVSGFFKSINSVKKKKGCLLVQFPPSLGIEYILQLDNLLNCISELNILEGWKIAIEFRNKSWYHEDIYDVLNSYNAAIVVQDKPMSETPFIDHKSDFIYIRFHGPKGNYRECYPEEFLKEYVTYLSEWIKDGKIVFVYFNNTVGDAMKNLKALNKYFLTR